MTEKRHVIDSPMMSQEWLSWLPVKGVWFIRCIIQEFKVTHIVSIRVLCFYVKCLLLFTVGMNLMKVWQEAILWILHL